MEEPLPRAFGPYLLLDHAGRGGMGDVYLARHGLLVGFEKHCVLKLLRADHANDAVALTRFADEARVVVQLSHRTICPVFDVGRVGGRLYVAMEHIVGRDLRAVAAAGPVPLAIALHIACEVGFALDYAHRFVDARGVALGLVHRDVSPHNVLLGVDGDVQLIDFGIATTKEKEKEQAPDDAVLGKLAFMSPEQARGDAVDGRSDQFSLAIVLAELVSGRSFQETKTVQQVWEQAGLGSWRPPWWLDVAVVDADLRALLDKALAAETAGRFDSCADFADALLAWARAKNLVAGPRDVQKHLRALFGDLTAEHRARMQSLTQVPAPVSGPGAIDEAAPFESIATTLALPANTPAFGNAAPTQVLFEPPKTQTKAPAAPPPSSSSSPSPSSRALPAVAALLAAALGAGAMYVVTTGEEEVAEVVVDLPSPPPPPPVPVPVPVIPLQPLVEAPPDPPDPAPDPEPEPAPLVEKNEKNDKPEKPDKPDRRPSVRLDRSTREGLAFLKSCVGKVPCAKGVVDWSKRKLTPAEKGPLGDAVQSCVMKCRLH